MSPKIIIRSGPKIVSLNILTNTITMLSAREHKVTPRYAPVVKLVTLKVGEEVKESWVGGDYKGDRYYDAVVTSIDADKQTCALVLPVKMLPQANWDTESDWPMGRSCARMTTTVHSSRVSPSSGPLPDSMTAWWSPSSRPRLKWTRRTHSVWCSHGNRPSSRTPSEMKLQRPLHTLSRCTILSAVQMPTPRSYTSGHCLTGWRCYCSQRRLRPTCELCSRVKAIPTWRRCLQNSTVRDRNLQGLLWRCHCPQEPQQQKVGLCFCFIDRKQTATTVVHATLSLPSLFWICLLPSLDPQIDLLFSSLSIDPSIHPRLRPAPLRVAGLLLPSLFPFLPSFLPYYKR